MSSPCAPITLLSLGHHPRSGGRRPQHAAGVQIDVLRSLRYCPSSRRHPWVEGRRFLPQSRGCLGRFCFTDRCSEVRESYEVSTGLGSFDSGPAHPSVVDHSTMTEGFAVRGGIDTRPVHEHARPSRVRLRPRPERQSAVQVLVASPLSGRRLQEHARWKQCSSMPICRASGSSPSAIAWLDLPPRHADDAATSQAASPTRVTASTSTSRNLIPGRTYSGAHARPRYAGTTDIAAARRFRCRSSGRRWV